MSQMSPRTHSAVMLVAIIGVFAAFLLVMVTLVHNAWIHDGSDNTTLVWFGAACGVVLAVLLLGVPVVASLLKALGLPVDIPTIPSMPNSTGTIASGGTNGTENTSGTAERTGTGATRAPTPAS